METPSITTSGCEKLKNAPVQSCKPTILCASKIYSLGMEIKVGQKVKLSHQHVLQSVTFAARVVKIEGEYVWLEIPEPVRKLPFPPLNGKRYGKYRISDLTN